MIGQVKKFDSRKKYGFISGDDGKEYFFHESEINTPSKSISAGYTVQFIASNGFPKPKALSVNLL